MEIRRKVLKCTFPKEFPRIKCKANERKLNKIKRSSMTPTGSGNVI
jgi:hypothetical protein